jgi:hypothetical protein
MQDPAPPSDSPSSPTTAPATVTCPQCGQILAIEGYPEHEPMQCPTCGTEFLLNTIDELEQADPLPADQPVEPGIELDGLRIRQLVQLRRASIRARTYAIIIMLCCLIMGAQLVLTGVQEVHSYGWDRWAILYAIFTVVMAVGAAIASRKAGVLHRDSKISPAPTTEPDYVPQFDDLSDGSHRIANLEMMKKEDVSTNEHE